MSYENLRKLNAHGSLLHMNRRERIIQSHRTQVTDCLNGRTLPLRYWVYLCTGMYYLPERKREWASEKRSFGGVVAWGLMSRQDERHDADVRHAVHEPRARRTPLARPLSLHVQASELQRHLQREARLEPDGAQNAAERRHLRRLVAPTPNNRQHTMGVDEY